VTHIHPLPKLSNKDFPRIKKALLLAVLALDRHDDTHALEEIEAILGKLEQEQPA